MPLTPPILRFNAVDAAIFPVQCGQRRYFSGSTPLMPLFFQLNRVNAAIFHLNAAKRHYFSVQRR